MSRLDEKRIHDVLRLDREGMKWRAIARALRISRNSVSHIVRQHREARESPHSALPRRRSSTQPSKLDPYRERIDEMFRLYPHITAQRVFEKLREEGFDGGYTVVKDLLRRIRPNKAPQPSLETPRRVPADMAECDWSPYTVEFTHGEPLDLQVFGYTLRYSTRKFYSFHKGNGLHPLMDGHLHAFARFGGVAHRCKYDNQKPVVLGREGGQPIYNPRFIDFATHYDFTPVGCAPRAPNEKPRVERSFDELTKSFMNGRSFRDRDDLAVQLTHWMDTICDPRPLKRERGHARLELFAEEQPLLRPLPRHPYDTALVLYKLCDIAGFVTWQSNRYSLPYEFVTDILPVRITESELFVYKPDLTCIARHSLLPRGAGLESVLDGHRPKKSERGPGLDQLRGAFAALGNPGPDYLASLEKHMPRSAAYHARKVLALREGHSSADLLGALEHALAYRALEHGAIERILLAHGTPRRLDQYVAERTAAKFRNVVAESSTEPRDLAEYDALPRRGAVTASPATTQGESSWPEEQRDPPLKPASGSSDTSNDSD